MVILGIDVSKLRLDAALWLPDRRKWYASKVDNTPTGIAMLLSWACRKGGCNDRGGAGHHLDQYRY